MFLFWLACSQLDVLKCSTENVWNIYSEICNEKSWIKRSSRGTDSVSIDGGLGGKAIGRVCVSMCVLFDVPQWDKIRITKKRTAVAQKQFMVQRVARHVKVMNIYKSSLKQLFNYCLEFAGKYLIFFGFFPTSSLKPNHLQFPIWNTVLVNLELSTSWRESTPSRTVPPLIQMESPAAFFSPCSNICWD